MKFQQRVRIKCVSKCENVKYYKPQGKVTVALFETTASAPDSAQSSLAPPVDLTIARALRIRAQGFRRENGASSRIQSRSRGLEKGLCLDLNSLV